jgi:AcrR family transcriptional regulator
MADLQRKKPAKETILDAAITLFARLGFEGASFSEITELCGAKRPLILYHYGSKEELWRLAVESVSHRFDEEMKAKLVIDEDAPDEANNPLVKLCARKGNVPSQKRGLIGELKVGYEVGPPS